MCSGRKKQETVCFTSLFISQNHQIIKHQLTDIIVSFDFDHSLQSYLEFIPYRPVRWNILVCSHDENRLAFDADICWHLPMVSGNRYLGRKPRLLTDCLKAHSHCSARRRRSEGATQRLSTNIDEQRRPSTCSKSSSYRLWRRRRSSMRTLSLRLMLRIGSKY